MKIIIIHGTGGDPETAWFRYVADNFPEATVEIPQLPDPDSPSVEKTVPFILENLSFDKDTVLIGHSSGCPLILSVLERLDVPVKKVILVAGFMTEIGNGPNPVLQDSYDWEKIKVSCGQFIFINSDDDPWNCNIEQGTNLREHLGGTQITMSGEGHFGSMKFNQPYKEFPFLRKLIAD